MPLLHRDDSSHEVKEDFDFDVMNNDEDYKIDRIVAKRFEKLVVRARTSIGTN